LRKLRGVSGRGCAQIVADRGAARFSDLLVTLGVADLAADIELVVKVGRTLALQPRDLASQARFLDQPRIARR
jgi:hypothetical protein